MLVMSRIDYTTIRYFTMNKVHNPPETMFALGTQCKQKGTDNRGLHSGGI